jgi:hypothetical protein
LSPCTSTRALDLALAAEIADNAGRIAMAHFHRDTKGWHKADGSPVSERTGGERLSEGRHRRRAPG